MAILFRVTLFVSAILLFSVQPFTGKGMLPLFGGAPAVWQTSLVFFQAALLAGYAYAHWMSREKSAGKAASIHLTLLAISASFLPLSMGQVNVSADFTSENQVGHLLLVLLRVVGLPFMVISATSPLLQGWFARSGHATSKDPYYLSVASNLGSFTALLTFPLLIEPFLTMQTFSRLWAIGFALLTVLIAACAWTALRNPKPILNQNPQTTPDAPEKSEIAPQGSIARWVILAAIPSSLMMGATTFVTTEVASIPLLGTLPLGIYLLSFVLAFAQKPWLNSSTLGRFLPFACIAVAFQMFTESTHPIGVIVVLHLVLFLMGSWMCHARLAELRPPTSRLTEYYLWMSVGGVLGGAFNALLAPSLFPGIAEYPLAILAICLLRPTPNPTPAPGSNPNSTPTATAAATESRTSREFTLAALLCLAIAATILLTEHLQIGQPHPRRIALFLAGAIACAFTLHHRLRFVGCLGGMFLAMIFMDSLHGRMIDRERNFFGVSRVTLDPDGRSHRVVHGNTIHGRQIMKPEPRCEPLTYFHRSGPLGRIFRAYEDNPANNEVGVTGLGCGAIAGYAKSGQLWDYYEIDPAVIRIATDTNLFTFIKQCAPAPVRIIAGDARLRLREARDGQYGLMILDAFASDSIPLHLLTREAMRLYVSKLAPKGLMAVNISNRYLDLTPVVAAMARDAGLSGYHWDDPYEEKEVGKEPSHWVVLAREPGVLTKFMKDERWLNLSTVRETRVWTDDYSGVLSCFKWSDPDPDSDSGPAEGQKK